MPGGDGTGPMGMGPISGRAAGYCAGYPAPGFMNPGGGRGFSGRGLGGRGFGGRGGGRGRRNMFWATGVPGWARAGWVPVADTYPPMAGAAFTATLPRDAELQALERQAEYFRNALNEVQGRLEELRTAQAAEAGEKK